MEYKNIVVYGLVFFLGFLSCMLFYSAFSNVEVPFSIGSSYNNSAPGDWINESQIHIYNDKIVIDVNSSSLSSYAPTGSMRPIFDAGANGIRVVPKSADSINVGDIVSYQRGSDLIVHRVVEKGIDSHGIYFVVKGDNNDISDGKIRFSDIRFVTIGILY